MRSNLLLFFLFLFLFVPDRIFSQSIQIDRGLIIYYNFDGNAEDLMGNNPGTVYGATLDSGICESQSYHFMEKLPI